MDTADSDQLQEANSVQNRYQIDGDADVATRLDELARSLTKMLESLAADVPEISAHIPLQRTTPWDVCSQLVATLQGTARALHQRLLKAENQIHEQALQLSARSAESQTDPLTGLANRRAFDSEIAQRTRSSHFAHCPLSLAMLDIDHFKPINDVHGHQAGDAVLRGLARALQNQLPPGSFLARIGGEEFAILLPGVLLDRATDLADQLRQHVSQVRFHFEERELALTISCGVAQLADLESGGQLLQRADCAMYASKQAGRNKTAWHDREGVHVVAPGNQAVGGAAICRGSSAPRTVVDLSAESDVWSAAPHRCESGSQALMSYPSRRANYCDGMMVFWYIRQRLAEYRLGGEPFCVLALDLDQSETIAQTHGSVALQFMMRAQMLHLDATLRDSDVVARTSHSRVILVLPRTSVGYLPGLFAKLRESMDRFAYPGATQLLEYSISVGAAEVSHDADPSLLVRRAEDALRFAQSRGRGHFAVHDGAKMSVLVPGSELGQEASQAPRS